MLRKIISALLAAGILLAWPLTAQQEKVRFSDVTGAIETRDYKRAEMLLRQYTQWIIAAGQPDSILQCVALTGEIATELYGAERGKKEMLKLVDQAKLNNKNAAFHSQLDMQSASYFSNLGQNNQAYQLYQQAFQTASTVAEPLLIAQIEYNLGVSAQRLANVNLSASHHRRSMDLREKINNTPHEDLYLSYNAMGSIMWYASKYDSATYFFKKALGSLSNLPKTDINQYYRPSIIQNNLAGLYGAEGKITEGIDMMKACIINTQKFIASPGTNSKKQNALSGLFEGMDNLAGLYRDIGDYHKAGDLLRYSYEQKKEKLPEGHPGVFISEILLGQHYNDIHEYDQAISYLLSGLQKLNATDGDYLFWQADGCYQAAMAYQNKSNTAEAKKYYNQSEQLYESSYQGEYDNIYLQFLRAAAKFYAANNEYAKALAMANKGLTYIKNVQGGESLATFYQLLNLAELGKISGNYRETIQYSNDGLSILKKQLTQAHNALDSVKVQVYQPKAILLKLQAEYALQQNRDTSFLMLLSSQLDEAHQILKRRRSMIDDEESINILVAENTELIEFSKQVEMELYQLTGTTSYLEKFINLHESGLYNRIRGRLDKAKLIAFAGIPAAIQDEEKKLRSAIPEALQASAQNANLMSNYIQASQRWNEYLINLKKDYPEYYNLRYGSPLLSLSRLKSSIPSNTTLVRYFFSQESLFALIVDDKMQKLVQLNAEGIDKKIDELLEKNSSGTVPGSLIRDLYDRLWQPVSQYVSAENIIVIPDGVIFALSFEILMPVVANSYLEISKHSLLSRYNISYHYSLYMIGNTLPVDAADNYVAFVPGFTEEAKQQYLQVIRDSVELDYQYLSLLSQPHTIKAARNIKTRLGGSTFLDQASTLKTFRENAAGHKIVHIGTHAEFNNQMPERSRLIFSKDAGTDSNYLFLDDIYDCNIRSDLAILTACESGKPGFQDGEGMVSMAHAFNYAGSNSILTGLWKIDEKASSYITDVFVKNLEQGIPAAVALKKAKLNYLEQAQGRTLAPAYWAGLVLIGQTPDLKFDAPGSKSFWLFLTGAILLAVLVFYFLLRSRTLKK